MRKLDITSIPEKAKFVHGETNVRLNGVEFGEGDDGTQNVVANYTNLDENREYTKRLWWNPSNGMYGSQTSRISGPLSKEQILDELGFWTNMFTSEDYLRILQQLGIKEDTREAVKKTLGGN